MSRFADTGMCLCLHSASVSSPCRSTAAATLFSFAALRSYHFFFPFFYKAQTFCLQHLKMFEVFNISD